MVYVYYCDHCGHEIEIEERMADHGKTTYGCIKCSNELQSKITGGSGFKLEGVGWAADGYKSHGVISGD